MRNLKKALALVLALMMALSLMSFASAADYADDSAIAQDEAVSVMSALGVFNGTDGGNFDPDGTLTRAQAAKIITYMLLGQEVADSLPNTGSKFTDCPDGRWYVGSVNYLTDLGIVAGRSETIFDPNKTVNGYEFAKMLLGALGYDSKTEQFEGTSAWSINIATTARRAGLGEGLAVSAISSVPLTREQASKLSFNTLTATMVYYQGGVSVGDVTVNPTRYTVANSKSNDYNTVDADQDELMQFCEQYFPTLKYTSNFSAEDDFGRKLSKQWKVGDDAAYTGAADAVLVYNSAKSADDIAKDLKGYSVPTGAADATTTVAINVSGDLTGARATIMRKNGAAAAALGNAAQTPAAALADLTGNGKVVEIYATDKVINNVVVTEYTVESVKNIVEKNGETTYTFSKTTGSYKNNEDGDNVIVAGTVAKDDVVTTVKIGSKVYVYPTSSFTGSQTAKKGNTVTIGGATYDIGTGVTYVTAGDFANSAKDQTYYVDVNGYLVKVVGEAAAAPEYAMIVRTTAGTSTPSLDNPTGYTVNVRAILADGSIADYTLATSQNPGSEPSGGFVAGDAYDLICGDVIVQASTVETIGSMANVAENLTGNANASVATGKLFGYTINNDGKMVLSTVGTTTDNTAMTNDTVYQGPITGYSGENTASIDTGLNALFTNNTKFVLYKQTDGKWATEEVKTGLSGLSVSNVRGTAVVTGNGTKNATASIVFLNASTVAQTTDKYVFIDASAYSTVLKDNKNVDQWTGIAPDGSEVEVTGDHNTITKDGLYTYDTDNELVACKVDVDNDDTAIDTSDLYFNTLAGASVTGNLLNITGTSYVNITDDTQVVYIDSELSEINGNKCLVVMEAKAGGTPTDVAAIYVFAAASHVHTGVKTDAKTANCHETGIDTAYWTCSGCGKYFSDETCTTEITATEVEGYKTNIDSNNHDGAKTWSEAAADSTNPAYNTGDHIQTCTGCNTVIASHTSENCDYDNNNSQPGDSGCTVGH